MELQTAVAGQPSVIVHAHCYQPPREDPWREVVDAEPSAAPDHDWNARIDRECYARLAAAEVRVRRRDASPNDPDANTGVQRLINLYAWCSFDVGATLCEWLDVAAPHTLAAMQAGDAASVRRLGHGNAIAAPYHHVILPLASPRDRLTEVRWGIADFRRRFHREPEGMWLPECAVDEDTLDVLAHEGIRFTILAPYQVRGADGSGMPVRWRGANGREITILPYDGHLAGEVAFGGLLQNAGDLARRLVPSALDTNVGQQPRCVTLATDGETFGHHHHGGERTLAQALLHIARESAAQLTNPSALVAAYPPSQFVTVVSPSAWSCAHGVERWRSNCGCRIDGSKPPAQEWRGPLRGALSALADECHEIFEREGNALFRSDSWAVRDAYGQVVALDGAPLDAFVREHIVIDASASQILRARELLELARASLRTFTSCAWFFDEVDRIEVRQVLRYAARALELSRESARLEPDLVAWLATAVGNRPNSPSAGDVFVRDALPKDDAALITAAGVAACAHRGDFVARVAVFDVTVRAIGDEWEATLAHRRTGQLRTFIGAVRGHGADVVVTIAEEGATTSPPLDIGVSEFPESIAMRLLALTLLDALAE